MRVYIRYMTDANEAVPETAFYAINDPYSRSSKSIGSNLAKR